MPSAAIIAKTGNERLLILTRPNPELLDHLLATARYGSSSLLLSQASGGNNSVKSAEADTLWVKASGIRLKDMNARSGFVAVRYSALRELAQQSSVLPGDRRKRHEESVRQTRAAAIDSTEGRPSLEATFHALFSDPVVLHLHPVYVNAFACMKNGHEALMEASPTSFDWIAYAAPGQELAIAISRVISSGDFRQSRPVVMQNHGFIGSGATAEEVVATTARVINAGVNYFGSLDPALYEAASPSLELQTAAEEISRRICDGPTSRQYTVRPARFGAFLKFCSDPRLWEAPGPLVPDDVVYTGSGLQVRRLRESLDSLDAQIPEKCAIAIEGQGVVLIARNEKLVRAMEETLLAHVLVRILMLRKGKPHPLPPDEITYLREMESEQYRIQVASRA